MYIVSTEYSTRPGIVFVVVVTGCIGVMWWGLGVLCWVGVVSWQVAGSCAPCRDGVLVVAALCAVLRRCGGSAGSCATWRGLGMCWVGVAGSCALCRDGRGWWRLGLACHVEAAWWGLGVCWVGVVVCRWVVGSCAPCQDGMSVAAGPC